MARRVTPRSATKRFALAAAWTVAFAAGLYALDRGLMGPETEPGWHEVRDLELAAEQVGPIPVPPYLPPELRWPPVRVAVRAEPEPAWWIELRGPDGAGRAAWIGSTDRDLPAALGEVRGCLPEQPLPCPEGWRSLSARLDSGHTVFLISDVAPAEAARMVDLLKAYPHVP